VHRVDRAAWWGKKEHTAVSKSSGAPTPQSRRPLPNHDIPSPLCPPTYPFSHSAPIEAGDRGNMPAQEGSEANPSLEPVEDIF
jgi:hypothetical protein